MTGWTGSVASADMFAYSSNQFLDASTLQIR
jgi:hypothetical protein